MADDGRSSFQSDLRAPVLAAMRSTLQLADEMVLSGSSWIDSDTEREPSEQPGERSAYYLLRMAGKVGPNDDEPIKAERKMLGRLSRNLERNFPRCTVVGDKSSIYEIDRAKNISDDSLVFAVDALDGSLQYEVLTFGYGSSVVAFKKHSNRLELVLTAIANSSYLAAVYEAPRGTWFGSLAGQEMLSTAPGSRSEDLTTRPRCVEGTVAVLAVEPSYRHRCAALLSSDDYTVFNTGGTPASLGLMFGGLESLVSVEAQTVYDASYLPILAAAGMASICTQDGTLMTLEAVIDCFQGLDSWTATPVPPFAISRDPKKARALADLLLP